MGDPFEVTLPKLGESIVSATVVQWLKAEGDKVALDEPLLEVSTDKVNSEIPSPVAGIIKEILVAVDEEIEVGTALARIIVSSEGATTQADLKQKMPIQEKFQLDKCGQQKAEVFSPAVLRLAQTEGLSIDTLLNIKGTGEGGRVTKRDLENFLNKSPVSPIISASSQEERIKMSGTRKAIADNMARSFYSAPHASVVIEADVTDTLTLIEQEKNSFLEVHGAKLTVTSFLIQATTKAVLQFPLLNATLDDEMIVLKQYVNVGLAVNVEQGLIVPVIRNCQERTLVSIAKEVADLSHRARTGKLAPDEVQKGTITLTNFGMTGALMGVPIIRYPEVAIVGAGTIQKRVIVREDDSLAVRRMIYLSLTFDHRVIDGIYGCQFLSVLKHHLEAAKSLQ